MREDKGEASKGEMENSDEGKGEGGSTSTIASLAAEAV
jgi:hypothetical protein